jgi:two-component system chemotaxis response regulator CheY
MGQFYILLAEDNEDLRGLFLYLLNKGGYEVKAVDDGQEALEALHERKPDAVVTDINMPNMDGLELIKWIRSQEDMKRLPVIAMTAYGENMLVRAKNAGATRVIAKPTDDQLCCELDSLLSGPAQSW